MSMSFRRCEIASYLDKVELKQTGLANDKKKHYIHHLLRIFKDGGDATNSSPGWDKYEEQDEEEGAQ